jgi:hypothetical protein
MKHSEVLNFIATSPGKTVLNAGIEKTHPAKPIPPMTITRKARNLDNARGFDINELPIVYWASSDWAYRKQLFSDETLRYLV